MATVCTNAFGEDWVIEFDYRVTYRGHRGRGADMRGPGEPPEPMEWVAENVTIRRDLPKPANLSSPSKWRSESLYERALSEWEQKAAPLPLPDWLERQIESWLLESPEAYETVQREEAA